MTHAQQPYLKQIADEILRTYVGPWAFRNLPWDYGGHVDHVDDVPAALRRAGNLCACGISADLIDIATRLHREGSRNLVVFIAVHGHPARELADSADPRDRSWLIEDGAPPRWYYLSCWPRTLTPVPPERPPPPESVPLVG